jgi:uncharacterized surface protein with fasciclin (FAS1) repeats
MKLRNKTILLPLLVLFGMFAGCEKWTEQEMYKRPAWLPGKLYTAVLVQENLTLFAECLRLTELDKILDVSGSWTVFAPTDEAMKQFLAENGYANISDIPLDELERIAEFHIVQNPWSFGQLQILGINGWRKGEAANSNPLAYKRETMLRNPVEKYWIKKAAKKEMIILDSIGSDGYKRVYTQSRKYVPIFYDEYVKTNGITSADFRFYFDRPYEYGNVYYAGAKIIKEDIFAENGFVHIIDKVVSPMLNAKELLEAEKPGESYKLFMEMVYWYYPEFVSNIPATFNQPEVRQGGLVDTLWDLNYANLAFNLHSERIINLNQTLARHNGLFAPTDEAFRKFIDGTLTIKSGFPHWPDHKSLPKDIVQIIISQNFRSTPIYPSTNQYRQIFNNANRYHQKEGDIIRKEFGSNCTFIGLDSYNPDRVFTSVTGPVFCRPSYSIFRRALLYSGAINTIANHPGELYFFPIPDYAFLADSSLVINWINRDEEIYNFVVLNNYSGRVENVTGNTLRTWILNQVGTAITGVIDGKQTIRTLSGRNIIWDHTNNTIRGTLPSTAGYRSDKVTTCIPVPMNEPTANGKSWSVDYWFNF